MTEQFFAQWGEDKFLAESGLLPDRGIYVDVGAGPAYLGSNTAFLRNRGWDGLAVDALDYSAEYADIGAKFVQAVVSSNEREWFFDSCNPALARVSDQGKLVECVTLYDLIRQHFPDKRVDLLSLDCEGAEWNVLMSGQWIIPPRLIVSEWNTASLTAGEPDIADFRVRDHLLSCGYELIHENHSNFIFYKQ